MREIPLKRRLEVLSLYLQGEPYDSIVAKTGVSKGSVAAIVDELKSGRIPGFKDLRDVADELRELAVKLRKAGVGISEAALGLTFFQQLVGLGIEPQLLSQWVVMCREIVPDESRRKNLMDAAGRLVKVEEDTGVSYDELPAQCETKAAEAKELERKIAALKTEEEKARTAAKEAKQSLAETVKQANVEKQRVQAKLRQELTEVQIHVNGEKRRLQGELNQQLKEHSLALDNIKLVTNLVSEELRKTGLTDRVIEDLKRQVRDMGGAHQVMAKLQGETKQLEERIATIKKETKETEARQSRLMHSVGQYRHSRRTLKAELGKLERLKDKYQIDIAKYQIDIDVGKWWMSLIADPTQLDKDTLEKFVRELIGLLRKRGGLGTRQVVWGGKVICECPPLAPLSTAGINEESVRKRMIELLAPLVTADVWGEYQCPKCGYKMSVGTKGEPSRARASQLLPPFHPLPKVPGRIDGVRMALRKYTAQ